MWLLATFLLLPAGQGAAAGLFGRGWVWPRGSSALMASIRGLATGHPGWGLVAAQVSRVPAAGTVYLLIVVGELLLIGASVWAVVLWWRHLGPSARQGIADRLEVERVLGTSRLRRARKVIRPDLYGPERTSAAGR